MSLTIIAISIYVGLLVLNFATASISYHIKAFAPLWGVINMLNKLSSLCVIPAIVIDIIRYVF